MRDATQRPAERLVRWALIMLSSCVAAHVAAQQMTILRYEPLAELAVTESSPAGVARDIHVSFSAFGARFAMTLVPNELLTQNLSPEIRQRLAASQFYLGTLDDNVESWVRLTRTGAALSGAMWDGTELYVIEPFERIAAQVVAGANVAPADPVVYRWADTLSAVTDAVASPPAPAEPAGPAGGAQKPAIVPLAFDELASMQSKLTPPKQLDIGLIADSEYAQLNGQNTEPLMLSIANVVDGIFFNQVGVRIKVVELRTYAEPDAFSGTDADELLRQLGDFKYATPALRDKGIVHLLTGRDLDEHAGTPAGVRLLGIANLGALCDERLGVSVTQQGPVSTALVAAHEIGHNFGAPHDAQQGSPCASTPDGFLMNPFFNSSQQFSQCSLQQMEAELAAATCLNDLTPIDVSVQRLSGPAEVIATRGSTLSFAVDFAGAADALEPRLTITPSNLRMGFYGVGPPATCNFKDTEPSTCTFYQLPAAGGRMEFQASFTALEGGPASLDIEVAALNDYTPQNNRYRFEFDAIPDARFLVTSTTLPVAVKPNQVFDADWIVVTTGQTVATQVRAEFRLTDEVDVLEARIVGGAACVHDAVSFDWLCPIGTLPPGTPVPLRFKLRADDFPNMDPGGRGSASIWLKMIAAQPIFAIENVWSYGVTITPKISDIYVDVTAPDSAPVGSKVTVRMRVGNHGPDAVNNVGAVVRTWTGRGLAWSSATSSRGSCAPGVWGDDMQCPVGALASGETVEVVAEATVDSNVGDHDLVGAAGAPNSFDTNPKNNELMKLFRSVAAAPPPAPAPAPTPTPTPTPAPTPPAAAPAASGGGGGGGVDLAVLLLLFSGALCRSRSNVRARH